MKRFVLTAFLGFLGSVPAMALSLPTLDPQTASLAMASPTFTADYDFSGIVALNNCSGSLVRFDDASDTDHALVLTNGHCVKMMAEREVYVNRTANRSFRILSASGSRLGTVYATKILYATMYRTDMAIYELSSTYEQILDRYNTHALELARTYPEANVDIEVISGYWRRGYRCGVEAIIPQVNEGRWSWFDSIRYSRPGCDVIGGTSGSPVVLANSRIVVGVNNTINEDGRECSVNNPCEVDAQGNVFFQKGYGYAQQTSWLYSCRDSAGNLDIGISGCQLPKP